MKSCFFYQRNNPNRSINYKEEKYYVFIWKIRFSQSKNYAINIDYFDSNFYLDKVYVIDVVGKINMSESKEKNDLMIVISIRLVYYS